MPLYEVTYTTKGKKRTLTETRHVRAIGETHLKQILIAWAKSIGKLINIIFLKEI